MVRGAASIERTTPTIAAAAERSERAESLRRQTVEPVRIGAEDIQSRPDRVSVDARDRTDRTTQRIASDESNAVTPASISAAGRDGIDRSRTRDDDTRRDRSSADSDAGRDLTTTTSLRTETDRSTFRQPGSTAARSETTLTTESIRTSSYPRSSRDSSSQIIINGNNNVIVQGDVTTTHPRPYIPPRRITSISLISTSPYWYSYGGSFVYSWSSRSCGLVAVVPYYDYYGVTYYYPSYHRRFLFVSLGGYWPSYRHVRYYWYAHPYHWYGSQVVAPKPTTPITRNTYLPIRRRPLAASRRLPSATIIATPRPRMISAMFAPGWRPNRRQLMCRTLRRRRT